MSDIKVTPEWTSGEPIDEEKARKYVHAFDLILATVHDRLVDLDARTVANALYNVALEVQVEAGMTHADVADLLETMARLSQHMGHGQVRDA